MSRLSVDAADLPSPDMRRRVAVPALSAVGTECGLPHPEAWITEWSCGAVPDADRYSLSFDDCGVIGGFLEESWEDVGPHERGAIWPLRRMCDLEAALGDLARAGMASSTAKWARSRVTEAMGRPWSMIAAASDEGRNALRVSGRTLARAVMRVDRLARVDGPRDATYVVHPVLFLEPDDAVMAGPALRASFVRQAMADLATFSLGLRAEGFRGRVAVEVRTPDRGLDYLGTDFARLLQCACVELAEEEDFDLDPAEVAIEPPPIPF